MKIGGLDKPLSFEIKWNKKIQHIPIKKNFCPTQFTEAK